MFTSALLPFPTAVVWYAVRSGTASDDARTAVALYARVGALLCANWYAFFGYLATHGQLLEEEVDDRFFRRECPPRRLGSALYLLGALAGYLATPVIALAVFFLIPAFYGITSHGLAELDDAVRRGSLVRRRHPGSLPIPHSAFGIRVMTRPSQTCSGALPATADGSTSTGWGTRRARWRHRRVAGRSGSSATPVMRRTASRGCRRPHPVVCDRSAHYQVFDGWCASEDAGTPHGDRGDRPVGVLPLLVGLEHDSWWFRWARSRAVPGLRARQTEPGCEGRATSAAGA